MLLRFYNGVKPTMNPNFRLQNDICASAGLIMGLISGQIEHVDRMYNHNFNPELWIKYKESKGLRVLAENAV